VKVKFPSGNYFELYGIIPEFATDYIKNVTILCKIQ